MPGLHEHLVQHNGRHDGNELVLRHLASIYYYLLNPSGVSPAVRKFVVSGSSYRFVVSESFSRVRSENKKSTLERLVRRQISYDAIPLLSILHPNQ